VPGIVPKLSAHARPPARLVAWHNRHPLARRLSASQVQSVGYVAVPFLPPAGEAPPQAPAAAPPPAAAAGEGLSLRERALARAQQGEGAAASGGATAAAPARRARPQRAPAAVRPAKGPLPRPAFSEDFIAPLRPRQVARWLARHGQADAALARGVPVRQVAADPERAPRKDEVQTLYALTAMVEVGGRRIRPLLSLASPEAVLGTRLWSAARVAAAAGSTCCLLLAAGAAAWWWPAQGAADGSADVLAGLHTPAHQGLPALPAQAASAAFPSIKPSLVTPPPRLQPALADTGLGPAGTGAAHPPDTVHATPAAAGPTPGLTTEATPGRTPDAMPDPTSGASRGAAPAALAGLAASAAAATPPAGAGTAPATPAPGASPAPGPAQGLPGAVADAVPPPGRPLDVEPTLGRIELPSLGLPRPDRARPRAAEPALVQAPGTAGLPPPAAAQPLPAPAARVGTAAGPAAPLPLAPPAPQPPAAADVTGPAQAALPPPAPAAAPVPAGPPVFALSTRVLRTRAESELTMAAMKSLLLTAGYRDVQVEVLPVGDDWRVVGWPFARRAQADQARSLLASRGMRLEVVDF
jgi:hypothetical protein